MTGTETGTTMRVVSSTIYEAFAGLQDWRGLRRQRRRVGAAAEGVVLELGVGTGRNLPYYTNAARVVGIDPDPAMLEHTVRRSAGVACPVELHRSTAEDLALSSDGFDTVVVTLSLCTIADPGAALAEAKRVLRPGGLLVFLEHERSPIERIARAQDLVTPMWSRISGGCHLNRPTTRTIGEHGFEITTLWRSRSGRGSLVQGCAVAAGS